eukprot:225640-Rhodomonas_salina.1
MTLGSVRQYPLLVLLLAAAQFLAVCAQGFDIGVRFTLTGVSASAFSSGTRARFVGVVASTVSARTDLVQIISVADVASFRRRLSQAGRVRIAVSLSGFETAAAANAAAGSLADSEA